MYFALLVGIGADPAAFAVVNRCPAFAVVNRCPAVKTADPLPRVVPAGHHAHTRTDGTVIVHADTNFGSAAAHAGIARPWPKTAMAGQAVPGNYSEFPKSSIPAVCPDGT